MTIKPCPFCKSTRVEHGNDFAQYRYGARADYVRCVDCGAQGPPCGDKRQATLEWNNAPRDEIE